VDLLTWTILHRRNLGPDKAFDLTRHPYLVDIYNETARRLVIYKASQMGASEYLVSYALHAADERGATGLYVFPTDTHVSDFSSARIGPAIEASAYLSDIVVEGAGPGGKRGADRVTLKRVRDRFIYLRGAKVTPDGKAPQLKAIDADVLILDEWDEMDPRAPVIARKRLGHSRLAEERAVSTPTYPERGIHAEWGETDQREWFVRCGACGERQVLGIGSVVTEWDELERPRAWHGMGEGQAFAACRRCGAGLDRLGDGGEWVAKFPKRDIVGFHLTKLFSGTADLLEIVQGLDTTDETKRKEIYNQDLGLPYVPRGGKLTDDVLDGCRRAYGHGRVTDERTVMGVDVGKVLHGVIRGEVDGETGEWPQRWAGEIESFEQVGRLMRRFEVETLVIDALPETSKARELQDGFARGRVWLAYYVTQKIGSKRQAPVQWNKAEGTVNLDRTRTLDETFGGFYAGTRTLPGDAREVRDYYGHLKAPVRVLEKARGGQLVARYVESGPDHLAHAENYCSVANMAVGAAVGVAEEPGDYHAEVERSVWV